MGRKIEIAFHGKILWLSIQRVDRSRLYGSKRRIGLDAKGRECASVLLTHDGRHVLGPGSTAGLYLDRGGDVIAREDLACVDERGQPVNGDDANPDGPHELTGPATAEMLLEHFATDVHEVEASELDSTLAASLARGDIYQTTLRRNAVFLLANEHSVFLLAAEPAQFDLIGPEPPVILDDDDDEEADLGFESRREMR